MSASIHTPGRVYIQEQTALKNLCELKGVAVPENQKYMRTNDGDFLINFNEGNRLCQVQMKATAKRGKEYETLDPVGLANAQRICEGWNLVNEIEASGMTIDQFRTFIAKAKGGSK